MFIIMNNLQQNSNKLKTLLIKNILHNKYFIIIFSVIIFFTIDFLVIYPYINNYIQNKTYQEVQQYWTDFNDEINKLMEYSDVTTGDFPNRYSPDLTKDIKKDQNLLGQLMHSDDYTEFVHKRARALDNWKYLYRNLYDELESLHLIFFGGVWEINRLSYEKSSSTRFVVESVEPIALGYKKCANYEKRNRPHPYAACKESFEYLTTKDGDFSISYTNEKNKIKSILNIKNKYFYLKYIEPQNNTTYYGYVGTISDYYCMVIYGIKFDYYEIQRNDELIDYEISNKTIIVFSITTISISIIILLSITIYIIFKKRRINK